ncbi:transcription termination/antitermination factor NusG [candidate division WOR-3 bacterium]|nr:transcription termination/antitermination factor NusG [candidate division WOR-3 bacterium]
MKEWYIIHTYSGQEYKVVDLIRKEIALHNYNGDVEEIIVPAKKLSKLGKKGKVNIEKKLYPGYIAIKMESNEELFKLISQIPNTLKFGDKGKRPQPMLAEEVERMLNYIKPEARKITEVPFIKGESVKIIDGPFTDFVGVVEDLYPERERLKLMVTIFSRQTPVEVNFLQVEPL